MENQEKEDKPKEEEAKEPVVEEKPRTRSAQPKEAAPAFMSSLFAIMDVYLNKMLVRPHNHGNKTLSALVPSFPKLFYRLWPDITELCQLKICFLLQSSPFSFQNYLARNFYNLRFLALFVCFAINFILLFYKVTRGGGIRITLYLCVCVCLQLYRKPCFLNLLY